jgi:multicopper oxidase
VIHCHILAHEDRGMMTVVQVSVEKIEQGKPLPFKHH